MNDKLKNQERENKSLRQVISDQNFKIDELIGEINNLKNALENAADINQIKQARRDLQK